MNKMQLHLAPMQGYTEVEYRRALRDVYGGDWVAYTPFLRVEKGEPDRRALRDILSPLNLPEGVTPQIIVSSVEEFSLLTSCLKDHGFNRIDINLGCPFPPQVKRGRGAGCITRPDFVGDLCQLIAADSSCAYSVKMRAGVADHFDWRAVLPILNDTPLSHITLHPRIAADQYRGTARRDIFDEFAAECRHPLIYNGDLTSPEAVAEIAASHPTLHGIMLGRGLLARPSLMAEYAEGRQWPRAQRLAAILRLHCRFRALLEDRITGGSHQLLTKLRPFWEYLEPEIGRKSLKTIKKATTLAAYTAAVENIMHN